MRAVRRVRGSVLIFGCVALSLVGKPSRAAWVLDGVCAAPANPIVAEICQPGDADRLIRQYSADIAGFASATSLNRGETLNLFVTTDTRIFDLRIYRTGYYGGAGARATRCSGIAYF